MTLENVYSHWGVLLAIVIGGVTMSAVPILVMLERWGSAWLQRRVGPNRVGPLGLFQPLADAVKLVFKEVNIPRQSHKVLFQLAPALAVIPPFLSFSVIPYAGTVVLGGHELNVGISSLNVGILFFLAISSLHVYSVMLAGWSSNNKFSLMGALRSSSQMISYEIAIGITMVSLIISYGTLDLREIVKLQEATTSIGGLHLPHWGILRQPVAFLIMLVCAFAETNRLPFDLPEGESELVAGYHTEYSGMNFALFMMGEYVAMIAASCFLMTLFFGGFNIPFVSEETLRAFFQGHGYGLAQASVFTALLQLGCFATKVVAMMWFYIWVRWTLPRFRYDQLMDLGWKLLLPIGVANAIATILYNFFWVKA